MPVFGPTKRRDLISGLQKAGFSGPFAGGNHEYMARGSTRVPIPNPHHGDISVTLLKRILAVAGISKATWESL